MNTELTRFIRGGRNNAAAPAFFRVCPDYDGLSAKRGVIALFYRSKKGIHIHVRDKLFSATGRIHFL